METDRLRQFCVIADSGSLTKAAEILNISLGGLSKSMKVLEDELGYPLFVPVGRGLSVSELGLALYSKARAVLDSVATLKTPEKQTKAIFRVAALEVFTINFLSKIVADHFSKQSMQIIEATPGHLETLVIDRKVDCALTYLPHPRPELQTLKIGSFELKPFAKNCKFKTEDDVPFIVPASGLDTNPLGVKERDGWPEGVLTRQRSHQVNMLSTALSLAGEGLGAVFMPEFVTRIYNKTQQKDFHLLPLEGVFKKVHLRREVYLVKRLGSPESIEIKKLVAGVRAQLKN